MTGVHATKSSTLETHEGGLTKLDFREDLEGAREVNASKNESSAVSSPEQQVKIVKLVTENKGKPKTRVISSKENPAEISKDENKKSEVNKEDTEIATPKLNTAGQPRENNVLSPKSQPGADVSDKKSSVLPDRATSEHATPDSKNDKEAERIDDKKSSVLPDRATSEHVKPDSKNDKGAEKIDVEEEEENALVKPSKRNWFSKRGNKSRDKKVNVEPEQHRGVVDTQESSESGGYCGNLCSEQQLTELQENVSSGMRRVWDYRHKIFKMQNSGGSDDNNCGSSFSDHLHQFQDDAINLSRRVFDCSGDSCYTDSKNWGWFNNAVSGGNENSNRSHFKKIHSLFS